METDQNLNVQKRVHIMPMGFEEERISTPARVFNADKLVIIKHNDEHDRFHDHLENVEIELEQIGITPSIRSCDIFDVYDSLGLISEVIAEHRDDEVYVNLSAGSKITAIAGMIACMCTDAQPYYARASDYSGPYPSEITRIDSLPKYKIDPPTADQIEVLDYLTNVGPSTKKNLIKFAEDCNLDFLADFDGKEKGKYRRLESNIISPLGESGYITVERSGRERIVTITTSGRKAKKAFKNLVGIASETDENPPEASQKTLQKH